MNEKLWFHKLTRKLCARRYSSDEKSWWQFMDYVRPESNLSSKI